MPKASQKTDAATLRQIRRYLTKYDRRLVAMAMVCNSTTDPSGWYQISGGRQAFDIVLRYVERKLSRIERAAKRKGRGRS